MMSNEANDQKDLQAQFRALEEAIDSNEQLSSGAAIARKTPINPEDTSFGGRP